MSSWAPPPSRWKRRFWSMLCLNHAVFHLFSSLFNPLARFHVASPSFVLKTAVLVDCVRRFNSPKALSCGRPPFLRSASPGFRNSGFENSMFEPCVRELYVRTPGSRNSMFEPWVRELYVRTLGRGTLCSNRARELYVRTRGWGTLCSNPGFGNSMFEPWVRELYDRTRGLETKPEPGVRTLGSGTLCSNLGFEELYVPTLGSATLWSNSGFGNSMIELGVWKLSPNPGLEPWVREPYGRTSGSRNSMFEPWVGELYVQAPSSGTLCWNPGLHWFRVWASGFPSSRNPGFEHRVDELGIRLNLSSRTSSPGFNPEFRCYVTPPSPHPPPGVRTLGSGTFRKPMLIVTCRQNHVVTRRQNPLHFVTFRQNPPRFIPVQHKLPHVLSSSDKSSLQTAEKITQSDNI